MSYQPQPPRGPQPNPLGPSHGRPIPPTKKTPTWVWVVAVLGGLLLISMIGSAVGGPDKSKPLADSTTTPNVARAVGLPTTTAPPAPKTAPASAAPAPPVAPAVPAALVPMPSVVCMNLQAAQNKIQAAGVWYSRSTDATGAGRMQIIDRNWIVVGQNPAPGVPIGEGDAVLSVVKSGEPNSCR
jgi:hypothetical protein